MSTTPIAPKGISTFIRSISSRKHGTPNEFAQTLRRNGILWAPIGGPWHEEVNGEIIEKWINKPDVIKRYSEAMYKYGVEPHIWGYPWHGCIEKFVEQLEECSIPEVVGWLLNPELGLKKHPEAARELVKLTRASNPYRIIGFVSYGIIGGHKSFPFEEFTEPGGYDPIKECDYGCPELYNLSEKTITKSIKEYNDIGFDIVIPAYGNFKFIKKDPTLNTLKKNKKAVPLSEQELRIHLSRFMKSNIPINAMIGWAENFITESQWRVIREFAEILVPGSTI